MLIGQKIPPDQLAALAKLQYDLYGTRLDVVMPPSPGVGVAAPDYKEGQEIEIARFMRQSPERQRRVV